MTSYADLIKTINRNIKKSPPTDPELQTKVRDNLERLVRLTTVFVPGIPPQPAPPSNTNNNNNNNNAKTPQQRIDVTLQALWNDRGFVCNPKNYVARKGSDGRTYLMVKNQTPSFNPGGQGGVAAWGQDRRLQIMERVMKSLELLIPRIPDPTARKACTAWLDRINTTGLSGIHESENTHPHAAYASETAAPFVPSRPQCGVIYIKIQQVDGSGNGNGGDPNHLLGLTTVLAIHELVHVGCQMGNHPPQFYQTHDQWVDIAKKQLKIPGL